MRKYKAPGTYATFVPTKQTSISSFEQQRVLAIVGTGQQTFERNNVLIQRNSKSVIDTLPDSNIVSIESISTKPITQKQDPSNKFFTDYTYNDGDNKIIWKPLKGSKFDASVKLQMGKGNDKFLNNIDYTILDNNLVTSEEYKVEITNIGVVGEGTYRVTKTSTNEIIGEYITSIEGRDDIIPGISFAVLGTIVYKDEKIVSNIGDYVILTTDCAKAHVDPLYDISLTANHNEKIFNITNGGSQFNTTTIDTGKDIDTMLKITNSINLLSDLSYTKFQLSFYRNSVLIDCDDAFDKLSVTIEGTVAGMPYNNTVDLFERVSVKELVGNSNCYDLNASFTLDTLLRGDYLNITYHYALKGNVELDGSDIILQLDAIKQSVPVSQQNEKKAKKIVTKDVAPGTKLACINNAIYVRNNVVPHKVIDSNEILKGLLKNIKISTKSLVPNGLYKIKIKSILDNEISIYDMNTNELIGTWTTSSVNNFRNAIPGLSFELYSFRDVEGLIEMTGSKDINDLSGSSIMIKTTEGIINPEVPQDSSSYYVTYRYAKEESEYEPKLYTEYKEIVEKFGQYTVTESGMIINGISLAAEIALQNGAGSLIIVQAKSETDSAYKEAIDKLGTKIDEIDNVNAIVALTNSISINKHLIDHVNKYSSTEYGMYRMAYLSSLPNQPVSQQSSVANPIQGAIQSAKEINDERIVYVVPGMVTKNILNTTTGFSSIRTLPGCYLTTAVAALSLRNDPAEPLTNKKLYGFNGLVTHFSEPDLNKLSESGCLAIKQEGQYLKVRHGVTTHGCIDTLADIQSNEITLIQIKDFVINGCRLSIGDKYVGGKLKPSIVSDIEFTLKSLLAKYIDDGIIINYEDLIVARDLNDPRQLNVRFLIEAVYPLNYIDITFGFSTTIS